MVARLKQIAAGQLEATASDINFYTHELREYVRYRRLGWLTGEPLDLEEAYKLWNNAHTATLEDYGLKEGDGVLYHPNIRLEEGASGQLKGTRRMEEYYQVLSILSRAPDGHGWYGIAMELGRRGVILERNLITVLRELVDTGFVVERQAPDQIHILFQITDAGRSFLEGR